MENTENVEVIEDEKVKNIIPTHDEPQEMVLKSDLEALQGKYDDLVSTIPKVPTEQELALLEREQVLFDKEVSFTLREQGFEAFAPILKVTNQEELDNAIQVLKEIHNQQQVKNSYIPLTKTDKTEYEKAVQKKDVNGMITTKFANFFKK